jgi:NADPH:quinone reductase-like Zn-dependent oxidoreductase
VVYDTVGGATIDASFVSVKRYTGHTVSCLGMEHALAGSTVVSGGDVLGRVYVDAAADRIWAGAPWRDSAEVEARKLRPLMNEKRFTGADIAAAHAEVEAGSLGEGCGGSCEMKTSGG